MIGPSDFRAFFRAVHGVAPFPWQERLADRVCAEGWPSAIDLPTAAGKTAVLDVAVFHLAVEADRGAARRAATRIAFVVDRRLVVDSAYERGKKLADRLADPTEPILARVAEALAHLAERRDRPLVCARLRGGTPREPDWARTPSQPTLLVSTVDQVGSRLLFRGYGVSDSMRPVHAGLLGIDCLFLLDEAHLSQPFVETLVAARRFQPDRVGAYTVVTLSATPAPASQAHVPELLGAKDRDHPVLGPRLFARKPATLVKVEELDAQAFVEPAWRLSCLGTGTAHVVAVVVNRIARARRVYEALRERLGPSSDAPADVVLLIGRARPIERDARLGELLPRMTASGRVDGKPLFVVATQCIEAGADLDFDALVTEVAPLDCLRQRFGRLNRTGRPIESHAVIVAGSDQVSGRARCDPIYGDALRRTWEWLSARAKKVGRGKAARREIDFGVEAARRWMPADDELAACVAPRKEAPVLLPAFVERWGSTSPVPQADPEVALFLHGPESGPGDVHVVWRADADGDEGTVCTRLAVCPPSSLEALSVPLAEARAWLRSRALGDIADVEGGAADKEEAEVGERRPLRWRGAGDAASRRISADELRAGDVLVVPSHWGGCDEWGWAPTAGNVVADLGDEANRRQRGRDVLRLSPDLLRHVLLRQGVDAPTIERRVGRFEALLGSLVDASRDEVVEALRGWSGLPDEWRAWLELPAERVHRDDGGIPLALERRAPTPKDERTTPRGEASTEGDTGSFAGRPISLASHSGGVEAMARDFARQAGLADALVADIALAAFLHDAGKAHREFQLWLRRGDELACARGEPLAKSGAASLPKGILPQGARHEVASLAFALAHPRLQAASDRELVLWLIGTHHGWGRPFFPAVEWPEPGSTFAADLGDGTVTSAPVPPLATLTSAWIELRDRLVRRYGPWGLAHLEAIVRLADHRRSEMEQQGEGP